VPACLAGACVLRQKQNRSCQVCHAAEAVLTLMINGCLFCFCVAFELTVMLMILLICYYVSFVLFCDFTFIFNKKLSCHRETA